MKKVAFINAPQFRIKIVEEAGDLIRITFHEDRVFADEELKDSDTIKKASTQLGEYFKGSRKAFDLPMRLVGTDFQMRVWASLQKIPYGKTISYKEVAQMIDHPRAYRAVGSANHYNPLPIIIPCHRVIKSGGQVGGYGGGSLIKEHLLLLERSNNYKT
ncbi:methylated-DNA--[protein]-cysteine S-methyltransferase [Eubacteriaceae bacterium ES2]|nr:methylated-DNA--[protein]-cysteine S-methyltransferase [Eubacteriaceae bacterium ES2]